MSEIAGILRGPKFLDGDFTLAALIGNIQRKNPPLVHISTHFCFRPGDPGNSFLVLGDDNKLSLSDLKKHQGLFDGVDLLVLAACKTALQSGKYSPREIDSMAELAQRLRARSVIATLWDADAVGAGILMIEIYKMHRAYGWSKAGLLRQAQLRLLRDKKLADENIDHPFYWAPFVLYGNFL